MISGATFGGNCTPVGASVNITGIGILKKSAYTVKNSDFFKIGIPFTIAAVVPAYILYMDNVRNIISGFWGDSIKLIYKNKSKK